MPLACHLISLSKGNVGRVASCVCNPGTRRQVLIHNMETLLWHLLLDRKLCGTAMAVWMLWHREVSLCLAAVARQSPSPHPSQQIRPVYYTFIPRGKGWVHTFVNVAKTTRIYTKFSKLLSSMGLQ